MTSTFLSEANKLKNIQIILERNIQIQLEHLKQYGASEIAEFHKELETERQKNLNTVRNEITDMFSLVSKFKSLTSITESQIENLDYKQIKKEAVTLSQNIKCISTKTRLYIEKLQSDEKCFNDNVKAYECKIPEWEKQINLANSNCQNKSDKLNQDVAGFLTFVSRNGGHTNSWSTDDHNLFLKARSKFKEVNDLCLHLHALLPDISEVEIEAHEKWYKKYLELKEKQKEAIHVWRKSKSAVLSNKFAKIDSKRVASAYSKSAILSKQEMKEKLEKWKQEKIEKIKTERALHEEMKKQQKQIEAKYKQKQEAIRKTIQTWRLAKLEKMEVELYEKHAVEEKEHLFRSAMANRLIKEFQLQDALYIKRKMESCKPKIQTVEKITKNDHAIRDPTRILKPTKQWIARVKSDPGPRSGLNNSAGVKTIQKLGVPEWRKGISAEK